MNITVFGSSGKVGRLVVDELLKNNHKVTAFIHINNPFSDNKNLKVIKGNIYDAKDVDSALDDANLVISTLGSWNTKTKDVLTSGMEIIIPAMKKKNISRIISLTGADARSVHDNHSLISNFSHVFFGVMASKILIDGERHIRLLENSGLDYTIIRSPVMREGGNEKSYELNLLYAKPWESISRYNVARAIVSQVEDKYFIRTSPYIHSK